MQSELVHVINTRPRIIHLPPETVLEQVKDGAGNLSTRHRVIGQGVAVRPSAPRGNGKPQATAVPKKDWDRAIKHPTIRAFLQLGALRLAESLDEETGEKEKTVTLMAYGLNTALTLVEGEDDRALLAAWLKTEARDEVKDAIKKRLTELQPVAKK